MASTNQKENIANVDKKIYMHYD